MLPTPELPAFEAPALKVEVPKIEGFKPPPALEVGACCLGLVVGFGHGLARGGRCPRLRASRRRPRWRWVHASQWRL